MLEEATREEGDQSNSERQEGGERTQRMYTMLAGRVSTRIIPSRTTAGLPLRRALSGEDNDGGASHMSRPLYRSGRPMLMCVRPSASDLAFRLITPLRVGNSNHTPSFASSQSCDTPPSSTVAPPGPSSWMNIERTD